MANTARTHLLIDNQALDWSQWAATFRERLPEEIINLQHEIGAQSDDKDRRKAILERLKYIHDLLRFSRFRVTKNGPVSIGGGAGVSGSKTAERKEPRPGPYEPPRKHPPSSDIFALFIETGSLKGTPIPEMNEPKTTWVSEKKETRTPPDLDDRAAKYLVERNLIMINADFRVFSDMVNRWFNLYAHLPGAQKTIEGTVHEWFEQTLIETVVSALALHKAGGISVEEVSELWSEESLTAAVLARYHIDQSIRRQLGQQLGSLKAA